MDLYFTDKFIRPYIEEEGIRLASTEDIIGMKLEVTGHGGRKKDFWDLHRLHDIYSIAEMVALYRERYPYNYTEENIRSSLVNFENADDDLDPVCLLGKHWELIKLDMTLWVEA